MKASELIKALQKKIDEFGDRPVQRYVEKGSTYNLRDAEQDITCVYCDQIETHMPEAGKPVFRILWEDR